MRESAPELAVLCVGLVLLAVGLAVLFGPAWACTVIGGLLVGLASWSAASGGRATGGR